MDTNNTLQTNKESSIRSTDIKAILFVLDLLFVSVVLYVWVVKHGFPKDEDI